MDVVQLAVGDGLRVWVGGELGIGGGGGGVGAGGGAKSAAGPEGGREVESVGWSFLGKLDVGFVFGAD